MRAIKLLSVAILSGVALVALADSDSSKFSCQKQMSNGLQSQATSAPKQYQCKPGEMAWVQLGGGENVVFCMGSGKAPKKAPTSVCEKHPAHWAEYTTIRHVCQGSASECAVEVY